MVTKAPCLLLLAHCLFLTMLELVVHSRMERWVDRVKLSLRTGHMLCGRWALRLLCWTRCLWLHQLLCLICPNAEFPAAVCLCHKVHLLAQELPLTEFYFSIIIKSCVLHLNTFIIFSLFLVFFFKCFHLCLEKGL